MTDNVSCKLNSNVPSKLSDNAPYKLIDNVLCKSICWLLIPILHNFHYFVNSVGF